MSVMTDVQSVPANTTIANAVAGKTHEFISEPSVISLFALASAAGMKVTLIVGEEVAVEDQEIGVGTTLPTIPYNLVGQAGGFPGDRVVLKLHNTTGGALTAWTRVDVEPA